MNETKSGVSIEKDLPSDVSIRRDLPTVAWFGPVYSNANNKYEYWILRAELRKMVTGSFEWGQ